MTTKTSRKLFVNLPVRDLEATKAFFAKLGFEFNPQFTDEKAACMIFSEDAYAMLLVEPFFQGFTKQAIADTRTHTEAILAFSVDSRAEVDRVADAALASGGRPAGDPQDHGFMYYRTFYDLDGHHWEVMWMDPAHVQPQ
jgi:predicted lactoylglutathione lyase